LRIDNPEYGFAWFSVYSSKQKSQKISEQYYTPLNPYPLSFPFSALQHIFGAETLSVHNQRIIRIYSMLRTNAENKIISVPSIKMLMKQIQKRSF
jgi:hypothetical protein